MKIILYISLMFASSNVLAQEIVQKDSYDDPKIGVYETKSLSFDRDNFKIIKPQTNFTEKENTAFIYVGDEPVGLFDRVNNHGDLKPVGFLKETSIVEIDTIFYNAIYQDTTKDWFVTFDVWYALKINGQQFFSDYQIHSFIAYKTDLEQLNQKFLLVAQSTGYDYYYDLGYPNKFFVAVLDENNLIKYTSKIINFDYGDEFWEPEIGTINVEMTNEGFSFTINGIDDSYSATWTGEELKKDTAGNNAK
jgi:hypothetical protein